MSIDLSKLQHVRRLADGSIRARCPACAADGHDRKGEHLFIRLDGKFGCCVHPGDPIHRRTIWELAGDREPRAVEVHSLGRLGRVAETPSVPIVIQKGILGRLGRVNKSLACTTPEEIGENGAVPNDKLNGFATGVPSVPSLDDTVCILAPDQAAWLPTARQVLAGEFDGADLSTIESLTIGLRNIQHPLCREALARLPKNKEKR